MSDSHKTKMKASRLFILLIILLTVTGGCIRRSAINDTLDRVDSLTAYNPDSALTIIEDIDTAELLTGSERARYALLLTQARYKSFIDETDDSLIRSALNYYEHSSDRRSLMLSRFYAGFINLNAGKYDEGLKQFLEAEIIAKEIEDSFHLGMIYNNLSRIYADNHGAKEEFKYANEVYKLYKQRGNDPYFREATYNLALSFVNNYNMSEAVAIADEAIDSATKVNDEYILGRVLKVKAIATMNMGNYPEGLQLFLSLPQDVKDNFSENDVFLITQCAIKAGDIHSADSIVLDYMRKGYSKNDFPAEYWADNNDYFSAYQVMKKYARDCDSLLMILRSQKISAVATEWHMNREDIIIQQKKNVIFGSVISISFLFLIAIILLLYIRNKRNREEKLIADIDELYRSRAEITKVILGKYFNNTLSLFHQYDISPNKTSTEEIRKQLKSEVLKFMNDPETDRELAGIANSIHFSIVEKFDSDFPDVPKPTRKLFILYCCGFSASAISLFLKCSVSSVHTRKSRLKSLIISSDSSSKDEFLEVFNI